MKLCKTLFAIGLLGLLTACGEPAPQGWNANIDINCKPHDPYDKAYAMISPKKFWREQEYDVGTLTKSGKKNLEMSQQIFDDSRAQKGTFFQRAQQAARDAKLTGKAARDHVRKNMDRYDAEVKDIENRIKKQKASLKWLRKCEQSVVKELRKLKLAPVPFNSEKRPM